MTLLGNLCLGLAALIYLLPLQLVLHDTTARRNDGGILWAAIFLMVPLWFLLAVALGAATSRGALDWTGGGRPAQYAAVVAGCLALALVTGFSLLGRVEPVSQMPVSSRPFAGWAVQVFPVIALGFAVAGLNPGLVQSIPPLLFRAPFAAIAGVSLLASAGLVVEGLRAVQATQQARYQDQVDFDEKRDRDIFSRVESLQTVDDFPELLGFANRFEKEPIREVALRKARAHPDFNAALAEVLRHDWCEKGLVYLDACDVADPAALAGPVREAIQYLARDARDTMERTHTMHADQFDWDTRLILSVAEKLRGQGVDFAPAIREFRAALDTPRTQKVSLNAVPQLDRWLASPAGERQTVNR